MPLLSARLRASGSVASTPVRERAAIDIPQLPLYEPPVAPLNEEAQRALDALLQAHSSRRLKTHLDRATTSIIEVAGSINEAGCTAKEYHAKKRAKAAANGEEQEQAEVVKFETLTGKIESLTQRLDTTMREMVDNHVSLEDLPVVMDDVKSKTTEISTQFTDPTPTQTQTRSRRRRIEDEDEEEDVDAEGRMADEVVQPAAPNPDSAPSALFRSSLASHTDAWRSKTLTSRYSTANEYINFYQTVHDAKYPGDNAPPMPRSNTWFTAEENPDASVLEEPVPPDEDLEIAAERISTKCPITFLPFKDPVTSTKCPHSFEREAIMSMMRRPTVPRSQRSQTQTQHEKEVACPVCSLRLTANDLRSDPALLRKVKRIEEAERRAEEEGSEEDDEEAPRGTQRRAELVGSSPATVSKTMARRIKEERMSGLARVGSSRAEDTEEARDTEIDRIPSTQMTNGGAVMVDLGDEDADDMEE